MKQEIYYQMALIWMMSHRGGYKMGHITRYGIKIDTSDFRQFWHGTVFKQMALV